MYTWAEKYTCTSANGIYYLWARQRQGMKKSAKEPNFTDQRMQGLQLDALNAHGTVPLGPSVPRYEKQSAREPNLTDQRMQGFQLNALNAHSNSKFRLRLFHIGTCVYVDTTYMRGTYLYSSYTYIYTSMEYIHVPACKTRSVH